MGIFTGNTVWSFIDTCLSYLLMNCYGCKISLTWITYTSQTVCADVRATGQVKLAIFSVGICTRSTGLLGRNTAKLASFLATWMQHLPTDQNSWFHITTHTHYTTTKYFSIPAKKQVQDCYAEWHQITVAGFCNVLIISHFAYGNSLFYKLPDCTIHPMQVVQNLVAEIICNKSRYDSATKYTLASS